MLRREVLHTYGHEQVLTLAALQDAGETSCHMWGINVIRNIVKLLTCLSALGLLKLQQGGRPTFPAVKKGFRLLLDNVNDTDPTDIAYTYAGYAPLSIRLVEHALRSGEGSSRDAGMEEALKSIPGPVFDVLQTVDEHGLPVEQSATAGHGSGEFVLMWHYHPPLLPFVKLLSNLTRMLRTDCFGGTRLALHVPSSSRVGKCDYYIIIIIVVKLLSGV